MLDRRKHRINAISHELDTLDDRRTKLILERKRLESELDKEKFNCECVKLNRDIGIVDMESQHAAGRRNVGAMGYVAETLSASASCKLCGGAGIPKEK